MATLTSAWACDDAAPSPSVQRYRQRLHKVLAHVHDHLDDDLDLNALADIACLSPWHWHRIYHALCGETLAETVKRLRLHRAAGDLANTEVPIARVAARAGYPSLPSFNRTFKAAYGLPPARYRASGQHQAFRIGVSAPTAPDGDAASTAQLTQVTVIDRPAQQVLALAHRGPYMNIGRAFDLLLSQLPAPIAAPAMLAAYQDDPDLLPPETLRAWAALALPPDRDPNHKRPPAATGIEPMQLRGGRYATYVYQGPYASMHAAYRWLLGVWLPQSDHELADAPFLEEYLNNPRQVPPGELLTRIALPLI